MLGLNITLLRAGEVAVVLSCWPVQVPWEGIVMWEAKPARHDRKEGQTLSTDPTGYWEAIASTNPHIHVSSPSWSSSRTDW